MHAANTPSPAGVAAASVAPTSTSDNCKVQFKSAENYNDMFKLLMCSDRY